MEIEDLVKAEEYLLSLQMEVRRILNGAGGKRNS